MKNTLSIMLMLFVPFALKAQTHIKNQRFIQINAGGYDKLYPTKENYSLQVEMLRYNRKINARGWGIQYARKLSSNYVPVEKFQAHFKQEMTILSNPNRTSTFKMLGLAMFGYESINKDKKLFNGSEITPQSGFILGVGTGAEYELSPFVIGTRATYNFLSEYQKFSVYPYVGIKIHLQ